ncbi:MAG TPA: enoyl-CoA hydratase/isomerase family protein [Bacteroidia bacterium]
MVDIQIKDRIAYLILNRPEKRNALDDTMAASILEALNRLSSDDECKVLVIKGNGEAFCAGADLAYLQKLQANSYEQNLQDSTALMKMFKALYEFPKITISQVEGPALAGGCGLAGLCDFSFATPESKFGYTEVKIGFIPAIVSVFLAPKIGENNARYLLLTGSVLNATEAKQMGLVNELVDADNIATYVNDFASKLVKGVSSQSVQLTKKLLIDLQGKSLEDKLNTAAAANAGARASEDCKKGIAAFLNKEAIVW